MNHEKPLSEGGGPIAIRPTKQDALDQILDRESAAYYCSFPVDTQLAKSTVLSALSGEQVEIKEVLNTPIDIYGFVVKPSDPVLNRDGEINVYPVSLLLLKGGRVIRSGSRGVLQSLRLFEAERPNEIWEPPITVTPKARNLAEGRNWIYLSRLSNNQE